MNSFKPFILGVLCLAVSPAFSGDWAVFDGIVLGKTTLKNYISRYPELSKKCFSPRLHTCAFDGAIVGLPSYKIAVSMRYSVFTAFDMNRDKSTPDIDAPIKSVNISWKYPSSEDDTFHLYGPYILSTDSRSSSPLVAMAKLLIDDHGAGYQCNNDGTSLPCVYALWNVDPVYISLRANSVTFTYRPGYAEEIKADEAAQSEYVERLQREKETLRNLL